MNTDRILSCSAIAISVIALTVSIWQGTITREHNKLSVQPNIVVAQYLEGEGGRNGIYIANAGLGPGIIKSSELIINSIQYDVTHNIWPEVLKKVGIEPLCFALSWMPVDSVIRESEELSLIRMTSGDFNICPFETVKLINLENAEIKITYESMYGESYSLRTPLTLSHNDFGIANIIGL